MLLDICWHIHLILSMTSWLDFVIVKTLCGIPVLILFLVRPDPKEVSFNKAYVISLQVVGHLIFILVAYFYDSK